MRLNTLALAVTAALSTGVGSLAHADENCKLLGATDQVDISRGSPDRCLPGVNPLQNQQWNLLNSGQDAYSARGGKSGFDLNLWWAHRLGVLGQDVKVAVVDDGLELAHPDLAANIRPGSKNFLTGSSDPTPANKGDAHGTSVAGIIAAADNKIGVKGVAPKVKLQGFNNIATGNPQYMNDFLYALGGSSVTEDNRVFNQSIGWNPLNGDNSNASDLQMLDGLYEKMTMKPSNGAVYVKSAGNGFFQFNAGDYRFLRKVSDGQLPFYNSNIEARNTNFWNFVVSATNADGVRASYSSVGSNVLVAAPGGEYGVDSPAHVTTDLTGCVKGYNRVDSVTSNRLHQNTQVDPNCDYNGVMNGTSSAAPNTTGSVALLLSAFPQLSPRDVRDILVHSSTRIDPDHPAAIVTYSSAAGRRQVVGLEGWEKNAAGYWFSPTYGFGLIDVNKALQLAATHTPLPPLVQSSWVRVTSQDANKAAIPDVGSQPTTSAARVNDRLTIEGVQVKLDIDHERLSDLLIELVSPAGTRSVLLNPRNGLIGQASDTASGIKPVTGVRNFRMLSNKFYGEQSAGEWKLLITDVSNEVRQVIKAHRFNGTSTQFNEVNNTKDGTLIGWSIRVLGH